MKTFIKSKATPGALGPAYRTPDHFKGRVFGGGKINPNVRAQKFNTSQFRTQHKGG